MSKEYNLERINTLHRKYTQLRDLKRGYFSSELSQALDSCLKGLSVGVVPVITKLTSRWGINSKGIRELVGSDAVDYKLPDSNKILWEEFDDTYSVRNAVQVLKTVPLMKTSNSAKKRDELIHFITQLGKIEEQFKINTDSMKKSFQFKTPVTMTKIAVSKIKEGKDELYQAQLEPWTFTTISLFSSYELLSFFCQGNNSMNSHECSWSESLTGGYRESDTTLQVVSELSDEDFQLILSALDEPIQALQKIVNDKATFVKDLINLYGHYAVLANL